MNYAKKNTIRYIKANLSPKQFRFVRMAPFVLALFIVVNFIFKNLQYEANKPIFEKYNASKDITYYCSKETNEPFTGRSSWILRFNDQRFLGSYKDGMLHGLSKIWHENGNLAQETYYDKGMLISRTSWDENGVIVIESQ